MPQVFFYSLKMYALVKFPSVLEYFLEHDLRNPRLDCLFTSIFAYVYQCRHQEDLKKSFLLVPKLRIWPISLPIATQ